MNCFFHDMTLTSLCLHNDLNLEDMAMGQGQDTPWGHGQQLWEILWLCVICDLGKRSWHTLGTRTTDRRTNRQSGWFLYTPQIVLARHKDTYHQFTTLWNQWCFFKYNNAKHSIPAHPTFNNDANCDLHLWPVTSNINRVYPLPMVNMSATFDEEAHNVLVSIMFTSLWCPSLHKLTSC